MWIPGGLQLSVCVKGLRPVSILAKVMPNWANANKKMWQVFSFPSEL